jgi:GIY-YIG catalytic domain
MRPWRSAAIVVSMRELPIEALHEIFQAHVDALPTLLGLLRACPPFPAASVPRGTAEQGVYFFTEADAPLYVGRTSRLRERLGEHRRPSSSHYAAPFAFRLAREATDRLVPSYTTKGGREELCRDPAFAAAFLSAKARVRAMTVQFVAEADPTRQALFEIYAATALGTRYNTFGNH